MAEDEKVTIVKKRIIHVKRAVSHVKEICGSYINVIESKGDNKCSDHSFIREARYYLFPKPQ